jgi:hypothetical protein
MSLKCWALVGLGGSFGTETPFGGPLDGLLVEGTTLKRGHILQRL